MARLTRREIRIRAVLVILLFALTLAVLLVGMVLALNLEWFVVLLMFIDLPVVIALSFLEWYERTHT